MRDCKNLIPAKVKYVGNSSSRFSNNKVYEAYFIEYWQGIRNSLHVKDNDGEITDFNPLEDFEILSDPDNLLNNYEAVVECITYRFAGDLFGITFGKQYKAIGRDKHGMYLVMDNSMDCYFYSPDDFRIISDKYGILKRESVYYSLYP